MSKYEELLECARAWEPGARLLGNVTAATIAEICLEALQLRADLATVTAERDEARKKERQNLGDARELDAQYTSTMRKLIAEQRAHAETKAALAEWTQNGFGPRTPSEVQTFIEEGCRMERELAEHASTKLAAAETRAKELERRFAVADLSDVRRLDCQIAQTKELSQRLERDLVAAQQRLQALSVERKEAMREANRG